MKKSIIAKELQGNYQVTILECGKEFRPFSYPIPLFAKLRKTGLFFDERLIRLLLPESMGNPPILTIMALAKKIAGVIREKNKV